MEKFKHVKYGILLGLIAILFGGSMGLSFGCCEKEIKWFLTTQSYSDDKKENNFYKNQKVLDKSWIYLKRAHLHSQTMGVIALVFSLLVALLNFPPLLQRGISLLSGGGSLGYGLFWLLAGVLAPSMGGTSEAKEAVSLLAQISGASFFLSGVTLFMFFIYTMFIKREKIE